LLGGWRALELGDRPHDRFAAPRCAARDRLDRHGRQTDIPLFTYSFFHQPFWEKPDEWLAHSSLMYVGHVTTPTLLMTGELDRRTPIPQTEGVLRGAQDAARPDRDAALQ